jgi:hypothetical protein
MLQLLGLRSPWFDTQRRQCICFWVVKVFLSLQNLVKGTFRNNRFYYCQNLVSSVSLEQCHSTFFSYGPHILAMVSRSSKIINEKLMGNYFIAFRGVSIELNNYKH